MKKLILFTVFTFCFWLNFDAQVYAVAASKEEYATQKTNGVGAFGRCYIMNVGSKFHIYSQLGVSTLSTKAIHPLHVNN